MNFKTLDEWAESRTQRDNINEALGLDDENRPGYEYDGGYIYGPEDGKYSLIIERSEWSSTCLERLEGILYENWIKGEIYS